MIGCFDHQPGWSDSSRVNHRPISALMTSTKGPAGRPATGNGLGLMQSEDLLADRPGSERRRNLLTSVPEQRVSPSAFSGITAASPAGSGSREGDGPRPKLPEMVWPFKAWNRAPEYRRTRILGPDSEHERRPVRAAPGRPDHDNETYSNATTVPPFSSGPRSVTPGECHAASRLDVGKFPYQT